MKHTFITRLLSAIFPFKVIVNCNRDPYLIRWYVFRTERISLFIHKFVRSDEDRALHDHPWPFIVIPIWRGYIEHSDKMVWCQKCLNFLCTGAFEAHACEEGHTREPVHRRVYPIIGTRYRIATFRHRVELLFDEQRCPMCDGNGEVPMNPLLHGDEDELCPSCGGVGAIREERPAWSLFIRFKREREWGFHPPEGFVNWKQWWSDKCE